MRLDVRLLALLVTGAAGVAWSATDAESDPAPAPRRLHCRTFETPLDTEIDTRDHDTEMGRWIIELEARGWQVESTDFEVGQKPTGFAQAWTQVCLSPVLN